MGEKKKMVNINEELQHLKQEVSDMKQLNKEIYGVTGFILAIIAICFSFVNVVPACICAGVAFVSSLLGIHSYSKSKRFAFMGIVLGSISLIFSVSVVTVTISRELAKDDSPSYESEYDGFKKLAYHAWDEQNGNSLLVLNEDGTYYWYQNKDNLQDNYTKGVYMLSSGVQDHSQQYVYKDDTFYYYQLFLTKIQVVQNQQDVTSLESSRQDRYTFGIDIATNAIGCVEDVTSGNVSCFNRVDAVAQEG